MTRVWPCLAISWVACVQPPPHATLIVESRAPASHAVLVLPTTCTSLTDPALCSPAIYVAASSVPQHVAPSFAAYIDPALRLKLEFAGFTLVEAGALRVTTADRVEVNGESQRLESDAPQTVADLGIEDVRTVATSLALTSVLVSTLTIAPAAHAGKTAILSVSLLDVTTMRPRWSVSCKESLFSVDETTNRLANCAGNGVLAVLAPDNLIGKAL